MLPMFASSCIKIFTQEYSNVRKQMWLLLLNSYCYINSDIWNLKEIYEIRLLVALCAICWRSWVSGWKLTKSNFTFQIWRMFRRSRRRPKEEWRDRDCQVRRQGSLRPGPAPSRTQSQSTESLASSSLGYDLHHSPIKSQSPINTCCVDNGENS